MYVPTLQFSGPDGFLWNATIQINAQEEGAGWLVA